MELDYVLSKITDSVVRFGVIDSISQCQWCKTVLFIQMGVLVHISVIVFEVVGSLGQLPSFELLLVIQMGMSVHISVIESENVDRLG
jgi:hypothetical protein